MICNNSFWIQGLRLPFLYRTHIAVCKDVCDVSLVSSLLSLLNFCLRSLPVALLCCIPGQQASLPSSSKPTDDQRWLLFHLFFVSTIPTISICLPKRWETSQAEGNPSLSILVWEDRTQQYHNSNSFFIHLSSYKLVGWHYALVALSLIWSWLPVQAVLWRSQTYAVNDYHIFIDVLVTLGKPEEDVNPLLSKWRWGCMTGSIYTKSKVNHYSYWGRSREEDLYIKHASAFAAKKQPPDYPQKWLS